MKTIGNRFARITRLCALLFIPLTLLGYAGAASAGIIIDCPYPECSDAMIVTNPQGQVFPGVIGESETIDESFFFGTNVPTRPTPPPLPPATGLCEPNLPCDMDHLSDVFGVTPDGRFGFISLATPSNVDPALFAGGINPILIVENDTTPQLLDASQYLPTGWSALFISFDWTDTLHIPEPASLPLFGIGALGLVVVAWRRRVRGQSAIWG
jgi:hypothetical protein